MNYSIDKVFTPKGEERFQLRAWSRGRKSKQIKRRFKTRRDAQNFVDKTVRESKESHSLDLTQRCFGPEYHFWRKENDLEFAPGWKANLDGYWKETKGLLEFTKLNSLEPKLDDLKQEWAELSPKTINNKMGFIYAVLNFSVERKRIPYNPLGVYRKPKIQSPDIEFLEKHEAEGFMNFLNSKYPSGSENRWIFLACLTDVNTGLRAGELWGLRVSDLKPQLSTIRVTRQFNRVSKEFTQLKGKESRSVPMAPSLFETIRDGIKAKKGNDLIFSKGKKPIDHDAFHDLFDADMKEWGGKRITFHGLRHTAATSMLLAGVDIKSLQTIMGHKQISTTMKYVHALGDSAKRASELYSIVPKNNVLKLADYG